MTVLLCPRSGGTFIQPRPGVGLANPIPPSHVATRDATPTHPTSALSTTTTASPAPTRPFHASAPAVTKASSTPVSNMVSTYASLFTTLRSPSDRALPLSPSQARSASAPTSSRAAPTPLAALARLPPSPTATLPAPAMALRLAALAIASTSTSTAPLLSLKAGSKFHHLLSTLPSLVFSLGY